MLLEIVSSSPWTYAAIFAVAALDALLPVVPSEATLISAGVLAGAGELEVGLVVAAGAVGALLGDTGAYSAGRLLGPRVDARLSRSEKAVRGRAWAERSLARRGGVLIFGGRFVPGGRTAVTVTAGLVGMRPRRFLIFAGAAGIAWASYAGMLGYAGGRTFADRPLLGLASAFAVAGGVFLAVEAARRGRRRAAQARRRRSNATGVAARTRCAACA